MERVKTITLEGLALLLVAGAGFVTYRLAYSDTSKSMAPWAAYTGRTASDPAAATEEEKRVTYRFLYLDEPGAATGQLTLGRFLDGRLCADRTWESKSIDHWRWYASRLFAPQIGWVAEDQPGWKISRWLYPADEFTEDERVYLFWSLQALRFLDPESTANRIDMIEQSGKTGRICLTQGPSDYDYDEDTLYWNVTETGVVPVDPGPGETWFRADAFVALAHQLSHMWHDLCEDGDSTDSPERQRVAVTAEDRLREILSRKDPTRASIHNLTLKP